MVFAWQNGAKLAPKWDQKSFPQKTWKNAFGTSPLVPNSFQGVQVGTQNRSKNGFQDGMHLGTDFVSIFVVFGCQVGMENPPNSIQKGIQKTMQNPPKSDHRNPTPPMGSQPDLARYLPPLFDPTSPPEGGTMPQTVSLKYQASHYVRKLKSFSVKK